MVKSVEVCIRR